MFNNFVCFNCIKTALPCTVGVLCILHFCLVCYKKSTANRISAAQCGAETSVRRSGGYAPISTDGSSIGQPDCETQAQEKTKERSDDTVSTVQTAENRQTTCSVIAAFVSMCFSASQKLGERATLCQNGAPGSPLKYLKCSVNFTGFVNLDCFLNKVTLDIIQFFKRPVGRKNKS